MRITESAYSFLKERSRGWCFTMNNPHSHDLWECNMFDCCPRYLLFSYEHYDRRIQIKNGNKEVCLTLPQGGEKTPHIQGYMYFEEAKTGKRMKELLPGAHLEAALGTQMDQENYIKKNELLPKEQNLNWFVFGDQPTPGVEKCEEPKDPFRDKLITFCHDNEVLEAAKRVFLRPLRKALKEAA